MVKDHQLRSQRSLFLAEKWLFRGHGMPLRAACLIVVAVCCGCQSGLVDPGRTRSSAPPTQTLTLPAPPTIQPSAPPGSMPSGSFAPGSSGVPGASAQEWRNVSRQPATSVIEMSSEENSKARYHTVGAGESWSSLGRQFGLSVKQLADANGIDPAVGLKPGQIVYIP